MEEMNEVDMSNDQEVVGTLYHYDQDGRTIEKDIIGLVKTVTDAREIVVAKVVDGSYVLQQRSWFAKGEGMTVEQSMWLSELTMVQLVATILSAADRYTVDFDRSVLQLFGDTMHLEAAGIAVLPDDEEVAP